MERQTEMPANNTVASTFHEDDLQRILFERRQACDQELIYVTSLPEPFCPGIFDGWSCWPPTPAGKTVYTSCPAFITGFDPSLTAFKYCETDGTWFRHPESQKTWSNYTTCVNIEDLSWQQDLNIIYKVGYAISLLALLVSLGIFTYFRSLRCARIVLHMNLFASFAVNNLLWLIWYGFVVSNADILLDNGIMCRLLHVILHYFLITNYSWMLCEGFYLHTMLLSAFASEHKLVKWLVSLGWCLPAIIVIIYSLLRIISDDPEDTAQCWINSGNYINVLIYPVCVSTLLNLVFLCNIVRVLVTKLRDGPAHGTGPSRAMLQAFRATLLLVPLLGLHYLIIGFRPPKGHPWEQTYEIISAITASFQGLCVAILFCFCNGEVITQFKRRWESSDFVRKRAASCTTTTNVSVRCQERKNYDYESAPTCDSRDDNPPQTSTRTS
ncbi:calcitonin gene-related peptide type 1 receptor-like [Belonocnema kinseyi]|uniref:calcitonin gene-related peptide type 1 receptor-like n=1 Tax=Belonocnema kinseyi TaxID=2817044 RepID=UPI00143CC2F3|nr:calcitonin gene-related peptide type 1 receptor-like [Belonocnema kinseyi]XP_033219250.1 calcitonin gene-related peptide type 1 receptor-like [Belonocnema kinseyi]